MWAEPRSAPGFGGGGDLEGGRTECKSPREQRLETKEISGYISSWVPGCGGNSEISYAELRTIRDRRGRVVEKAIQNKDRERWEGIREPLISGVNSIPKGVILRHTGAWQEETPQKACQPPRPGVSV